MLLKKPRNEKRLICNRGKQQQIENKIAVFIEVFELESKNYLIEECFVLFHSKQVPLFELC